MMKSYAASNKQRCLNLALQASENHLKCWDERSQDEKSMFFLNIFNSSGE